MGRPKFRKDASKITTLLNDTIATRPIYPDFGSELFSHSHHSQGIKQCFVSEFKLREAGMLYFSKIIYYV